MSCDTFIIEAYQGDLVERSWAWGENVECSKDVKSFDLSGRTGESLLFDREGNLVQRNPLNLTFTAEDADNIFTSIPTSDLEVGDYSVKFRLPPGPDYLPSDGKIILQVRKALD